MYTKLGVHVTTGSRNGYGQVAAAGPSVATIVNEFGAIAELPQATAVIIRTTAVPNHEDVPADFDQLRLDQMPAAAAYWWPKLYDKVKQYTSLENVWFQPVNETGGNNEEALQKIIAYEAALLELAKSDGVKLAIGSLAGDSPVWDLWLKYYVPFLKKATAYGAIYNRHAYGGVPVGEYKMLTNNGQAGSVNAARPFREAEYLKSQGINIPIIISEAGQYGGYGFVGGDLLMKDYAAYDALCLIHDNVWGVCGWTYGDYRGANIQDASGRLADYLNEREIAPRSEAAEPSGYKSVVVLMPQEYNLSGWLTTAEYAFSNYKRTMTASADNALVMVKDGNHESYVIVLSPEQPSQQRAIEKLLANGVTLVFLQDASPLEGLRLGYLLDRPYVYTSYFNDVRSYGKHEGIDADVLEAGDSKAKVLCVYDGTIDRAATSATGYGRQVIVRHERHNKPFYTRYAHLDFISAIPGKAIKQGEPLGEIGDTGNVTGEHLHFNLEVPNYGLDGYVVPNVVDPKPYLPVPPVAVTTIDLLPYLKGDGRLYEVRNVNGGQQRHQTQQSGAYFYQTKDNEWEQLFFDGSYIWRGTDTSPGGGRYYRLLESGNQRGRWIPQHMAVGETFVNSYSVQFYKKVDCTPTSPEHSGYVTNTMSFNARYTTYVLRTGLVLSDVIELEWVNGGEKYFYARNFGLVAWERSHQDPNTPAWSAVSEIHQAGARPDNTRESGCFG